MGVVVADTGPLHYLLLLDHIDVLSRLYGQIVVPLTVISELRHPRAPAIVRSWAGDPPLWLLVQPDPADDASLPASLDPGERAAVALALNIGAQLLLADDREARAVARARGLAATGTLGTLDRGARAGLLDIETTIAALRATNFRYPSQMFEAFLAEHRRRRGPGGEG